jgi:hypothetical protein
MFLHAVDERRVGLEPRVHRGRVAFTERALDFVRHVITPAAVQLVGVGHVAGRLFEVRHQASPLEDLGEDVRHVLARDVRAAQLRDRVVPVVAEDLRVQLFRALDADGRRLGLNPARLPANSSRNKRRSDFADRE